LTSGVARHFRQAVYQSAFPVELPTKSTLQSKQRQTAARHWALASVSK